MGTSYNNLGALQRDLGKPNDAFARYQKALAIKEKLSRENPGVTEYVACLGASHGD